MSRYNAGFLTAYFIGAAALVLAIIILWPAARLMGGNSSSDSGGADDKSERAHVFSFGEVASVVVESGETRKVPLSLLFGKTGGKNPSVTFSDVSGDELAVSYEPPDIVIKTVGDFAGGASAIVVNLDDGIRKISRSLLVKVVKTPSLILRYKPDSPSAKVFAAGDFNSWSQTATPLEGPDSNGYYVSRPLKLQSGGEYKYKFVVDGKWIPDPANPETSPDGFGGNNSVIRVKGAGESHNGRWFAVSFSSDGKIRIGYYYGESGAPLAVNNGEPSLVIVTPYSVLSYKKGDYSVSTGKSGDYADYVDINISEGVRRVDEIRVNGKDSSGAVLKEFILKLPTENAADDSRWENRVIYFAFTDRFSDGDKHNDKPSGDPEVEPPADWAGGDFAGITARIREGYFDRLGVGALWISPHIKNPPDAYRDAMPPHKKFTGYHGYWPVSFEETDPHFGTLEELKTLVAEAHKHGIKVILDMVLNHAHNTNPLYKKVHPEWFSDILLPDGRKNIRLFDERPEDTWFDEFLPDFDYSRNPAAIEYMVSNCIYWIKETGCDGFRLDAVKHIPMEFWLALRKRIREEIEIPSGKKFYLVGESISSREKIMEYVGFDRLDGQFDFPLYWAVKDVFAWQTKGLDYLASEAEKSANLYRGSLPSPIIGNHDFARFVSFADGSIPPGSDEKARSWQNRPPAHADEVAHKKLRLAFAFLLTQSNCVPMIYYGDEIGMPGAGDPDNRRVMKFKGLSGPERRTFEMVSRLAGLRRRSMAISSPTDERTLFAGKDIWAYVKNYFNKDYVLVVLNRSDKPFVLAMDTALKFPSYYGYDSVAKNLWTDVITGKKYTLPNNKGISVAPMSAAVLRCERVSE